MIAVWEERWRGFVCERRKRLELWETDPVPETTAERITIEWHELGCPTNYDEPMSDKEVEDWSNYYETGFRDWFELQLWKVTNGR